MLDEPTAGRGPQGAARVLGRDPPAGGDGLTVLVSTHYMDEAERCHRINYIAYGRLVAQGTVAEVVQAGLADHDGAGRADTAGRARHGCGRHAGGGSGGTLSATRCM